MQPRQSRETSKPVRPNFTYSLADPPISACGERHTVVIRSSIVPAPEAARETGEGPCPVREMDLDDPVIGLPKVVCRSGPRHLVDRDRGLIRLTSLFVQQPLHPARRSAAASATPSSGGRQSRW